MSKRRRRTRKTRKKSKRRKRKRRRTVTDEIHTTLVDHVINHGLTLQESGQKVQLNLTLTVADVIQIFQNENR